MDEAAIRQRCEAVFRNATGHPSFLGRDGVDLRDVFAEMIRAAYADGLAVRGIHTEVDHVDECGGEWQGPLTPGEE